MNMFRFEGGKSSSENLTPISDDIQNIFEECVRELLLHRDGAEKFLIRNPSAQAVIRSLNKFTPSHPLRRLLDRKLGREGLSITILEQAHYEQIKKFKELNILLANEPKEGDYKKIADTLFEKRVNFKQLLLQVAARAIAVDSGVKYALRIAQKIPNHPFSQWLKAIMLELLTDPGSLQKLEETFYAEHCAEAVVQDALKQNSTGTSVEVRRNREQQARTSALKGVESLIDVFYQQKLFPSNDQEIIRYAHQHGLIETEISIALSKSSRERDTAIAAMGVVDKKEILRVYDAFVWKPDKSDASVEDFKKQTLNNLAIYKKILIQSGFTPDSFRFEQLIPSWIDAHYAHSSSKEAVESYIAEFRRTIKTMIEIEIAEPGACAILYRDFGIKTFGRYPAEMLVEQYRQRDKDISYGLVMFPRADHNGSFYTDIDVFNKMFADSKKLGVGIRVMEIEHAVDLPAALIATNARYGYIQDDVLEKKAAKNLLSFLVLGGHGTPNTITLARPELGRGSRVATGDIMGPEIAVAKYFFEEGANGVLFSCSTGQNFAPSLSMRLDIPFIGPSHDSYPTGVEMKKNPNKKGLRLIPAYEDEFKKPVTAVGIEKLTID